MNESISGLDDRRPSRVEQPRREVMVEPEVVTTLLRLRALGWSRSPGARSRCSCSSRRSVSRAGCAIEIDGNAYLVPWRLIGERVEVIVAAGQVRVRHGASEVAVHQLVEDRRQRVIDTAHLAGVAGLGGRPVCAASVLPHDPEPSPLPALLRPLTAYEALTGGGF